MKYQFKRIMLLTILTTIFLSACQPAKNEMDSLEQYRTEYIGDNNNVIKIASYRITRQVTRMIILKYVQMKNHMSLSSI